MSSSSSPSNSSPASSSWLKRHLLTKTKAGRADNNHTTKTKPKTKKQTPPIPSSIPTPLFTSYDSDADTIAEPEPEHPVTIIHEDHNSIAAEKQRAANLHAFTQARGNLVIGDRPMWSKKYGPFIQVDRNGNPVGCPHMVPVAGPYGGGCAW